MFFLVLAVVAVSFEAVAAINRTVTTGLERNLSGNATAIANYVVHLTLVLRMTAVCAASLAAAWFVLKTFFCKELLFRSRESEFCATIAAAKCFVFVHIKYLQSFLPILMCHKVVSSIRTSVRWLRRNNLV